MNQNGADENLAEALAIEAVNDYKLYRWARSIIINYARKRVKGEYNRELAIKGFIPVAEAALKEHRKFTNEYYEGERTVGRVSMATKRLAAAEILDHYEDEIREMTQKMQGVKNAGKPWQRRNAEGKEWFSVAKKGRHATRKSPKDLTYSPQWSGVSYAPHARGVTCARCGHHVHREGDAYYCPACDDYVSVTQAKLSGKKASKKKPTAGFGSIRIGRVW